MPRQQQPRRPANPPPGPPPEAVTGLAAIRSHGGRDEELYLEAGGPFEERFMTETMLTAEESVRFTKAVERAVRGSREYKAYVSYLRNDLAMNTCSVMPNVDVTTDEVGLEYHHCPLTLFDICEIVIAHRLARGQPVTSLSVADEVMAAHMRDHVGVVPLLASLHKLAHAGAIVIHPAQVHGDWLALLREYPDGVTEAHVERLSRFCAVTEADLAPGLAKLGAGPPRLRNDSVVPRMEQVELLLLGRG